MSTDRKVVKLRIIDGVIYADSRDIARDFGKRHAHVLRDIVQLLQALNPNVGSAWFRSGEYYDQTQRKLPCYELTRQGWQLLVMNYQGLVDWKVAYILKFDEMEAKLGANARTEALFERNKQNNVVAFQGPVPAQGELDLTREADPFLEHLEEAELERFRQEARGPTNQLTDAALWKDTLQITWARDGRLREWFERVGPDGRIE